MCFNVFVCFFMQMSSIGIRAVFIIHGCRSPTTCCSLIAQALNLPTSHMFCKESLQKLKLLC